MYKMIEDQAKIIIQNDIISKKKNVNRQIQYQQNDDSQNKITGQIVIVLKVKCIQESSMIVAIFRLNLSPLEKEFYIII